MTTTNRTRKTTDAPTATTDTTPDAPGPAPETGDTMDTTTDTAPDWDALLGTATLTDRDSHGKRPNVDVDAKVIAYAQMLYDNKKRAEFTVRNGYEYATQKLMWQSAADLTTPISSATVTEVRKGEQVVGLRVSFGKRRGVKTDKPAAAAPAKDDSDAA